jgi:hypothetical protein
MSDDYTGWQKEAHHCRDNQNRVPDLAVKLEFFEATDDEQSK